MQYIGARYVTKIYENSGDPSSAEWEASVNYEPLTMVTYNNGSYLSKKAVPASAGDPPSEPSYWAQTGFYNGQIAYLQSQIDTINALLATNIENDDHYLVTIGDSYFDGNSKAIPNAIAAYFGKTAGTNYFDFSGGGLGFVAPSVDYLHQNWLPNHVFNALTSAQKAKVRTIILGFGANDCRDGSLNGWSDFTTSMHHVAEDLASEFPNARVYLAYTITGWFYGHDIREFYATLYQTRSITEGWIFLGNVGNCCRMGTNAQLVNPDGIHPTLSGCGYMAKDIVNSMLGGYILNNWYYTPTESFDLNLKCEDDVLKLKRMTRKTYTAGGNVTFAASATANGNNPILTLYDPGYSVNGQSSDLLMVAECSLMVQISGGYSYCDAIMRYYGNGVITYSPVALSGANYDTITPLANGAITVSPHYSECNMIIC